MRNKALIRYTISMITALCAGAGLSALAWVLGASFGWLALIGIAFAFKKSITATVIFGYWMVAGWVFPGVFVNFFHVSALIGVSVDGAVAALAALAALVSVGVAHRIFRCSAFAGAFACILFLALSVLPPLGAVLNSSPLIAAAVIAPGLGLWGLALTAVFMATLAWVALLALTRGNAFPPLLSSLTALAALGWISLAAHAGVIAAPVKSNYQLEALTPPARIAGAGGGAFIDALYAEDLARQVHQRIAGHHVHRPLVLLAPEGALPRYRAASAMILARLAGNLPAGVSVVLGTFANAACDRDKFSRGCVNGASDLSLDAVVVLRAHHLGLIGARMPAPIGEWRPWAGRSVQAHWFAGPSERIALAGGAHAVVLVCYEQWLMWPAMRAALNGSFQILLAPSSHRWPHAGAAVAMQRRLAQAEARIYGARLLYADARAHR